MVRTRMPEPNLSIMFCQALRKGGKLLDGEGGGGGVLERAGGRGNRDGIGPRGGARSVAGAAGNVQGQESQNQKQVAAKLAARARWPVSRGPWPLDFARDKPVTRTSSIGHRDSRYGIREA